LCLYGSRKGGDDAHSRLAGWRSRFAFREGKKVGRPGRVYRGEGTEGSVVACTRRHRKGRLLYFDGEVGGSSRKEKKGGEGLLLLPGRRGKKNAPFSSVRGGGRRSLRPSGGKKRRGSRSLRLDHRKGRVRSHLGEGGTGVSRRSCRASPTAGRKKGPSNCFAWKREDWSLSSEKEKRASLGWGKTLDRSAGSLLLL